MPKLDGFGVLEWLGQNPDLKPPLVVAVTGYLEYKDAERAYHLGANTFLSKPCTGEDVHNLKQAFANLFDISAPSAQASGDGRLQV